MKERSLPSVVPVKDKALRILSLFTYLWTIMDSFYSQILHSKDLRVVYSQAAAAPRHREVGILTKRDFI